MYKIGILSPSEIAFRRFLPALESVKNFEFAGIAVAGSDEWFGGAPDSQILVSEKAKAEKFTQGNKAKIFESYKSLIDDPNIDCIYIPSPALHFEWAKYALQKGKNVLLEKPSTDSLEKTTELIEIAKSNSLALHENYMFRFHSQLEYIQNLIRGGEIGEVRLYRTDFTFPMRAANDFRYKKALGGGALLDCGGYTLKLANILLGETAIVKTANLQGKTGFEVDIFGNATLENNSGQVAQISFGMDNFYRCSLEVLGSKGRIFTNRIFSAPAGFEPEILLENSKGSETVKLTQDDTFEKSIRYFENCLDNPKLQAQSNSGIIKQAEFVQIFLDLT